MEQLFRPNFWCIRDLALCALLIASAPGLAGAEYQLLSIQQVGAPVVNKKDLLYTTHLEFSEVPENFWIYYDHKNECLVVDIYGDALTMEPGYKIRNNEVFRGVKVFNRETSMSLSGAQALIQLKAEPSWHFEATSLSKTVIQIKAWKMLVAPKPVAVKKNQRTIVYIATAIASSVTAFLIIFFVGHSNT